ncbi:MAG: saccharopine dehydrogenase C-terminal domain-containing protein [Anaerolineae bacterium]
MKKALVLGAGLVAGPLVNYLLDHGHGVTVASRTLGKAKALVGDHQRGEAVQFEVSEDTTMLDDLVSQASIVVSLLPYTYHVKVAKACIEHQRSLVTTSYVSDEMQALDSAARQAGVILLNEIGLDPGIDHMSAMRVIDRVHAAGGQVRAFKSFCGGLPAPEANDNPLGYKFSWSPRGVVLAGRNDGCYLEHGCTVEVPNERLFATHYVTWVEGLGDFEAYPNRDSLPYIERYGIPEADTIYRGTLRNLGWCDAMQKLNELGYFSLQERDDLLDRTFRQVTAELIGSEDTPRLRADLATTLNTAPNSGLMLTLQWLGLLDDEPVPARTTLLDVLADRMLEKMPYGQDERDMIILVHEFQATYPGREEAIRSTLVDFGVPGGDTAMARTVGLPAGVGARMILEGEIDLPGVHIPVAPQIYAPVLKELEDLRIAFEETVSHG